MQHYLLIVKAVNCPPAVAIVPPEKHTSLMKLPAVLLCKRRKQISGNCSLNLVISVAWTLDLFLSPHYENLGVVITGKRVVVP